MEEAIKDNDKVKIKKFMEENKDLATPILAPQYIYRNNLAHDFRINPDELARKYDHKELADSISAHIKRKGVR